MTDATGARVSKALALSVSKGSQTITFTTTPPSSPLPGSTYAVRATATSGLTVSFSIDKSSTKGTCSYSSLFKRVSFKAAGTCIVDANQAGNSNWNPAPKAQQTIIVK